MSHIMPDPVADLIPCQRPKPAAPAPSPFKVAMLSASKRPAEQIEAASRLSLIESKLEGRECPRLTDQAREELLVEWSKADKVLSGVPLRQSTAVLS